MKLGKHLVHKELVRPRVQTFVMPLCACCPCGVSMNGQSAKNEQEMEGLQAALEADYEVRYVYDIRKACRHHDLDLFLMPVGMLCCVYPPSRGG